MPPQEQFSILLVDNDRMIVRILNRILHEFTPIRFASSGSEALRLAHESVPDLVLLDVNMPDMNGFDVCKAFKLSPALSQVPVVFITSHQNAEIQAKALELGAADFLSKPPEAPVVLARVRTFQRMKVLSDSLSGTLRNAITMDFLTGTITRHEFEKTLEKEWLRSNRSATPLTMLLADIIGFSAYNAELGEDKGDACLQSVAGALRSVANRPADILARYAGGRFAILLPDTNASGAGTVAQRAIDAVEALQIHRTTSAFKDCVTLSMGGCCRDFSQELIRNTGAPHDVSPAPGVAHDLIAASEQALTNARAQGGSQCRFVEFPQFEGHRSERALHLRQKLHV